MLAKLNEYGAEKWQPEADRVRLAVLKLAKGNLQQLSSWLEQAKGDWREVLGPAEYPLYGKKWGRMDRMPEDEQKKIVDADWAQYERWLRS